MDRTDRRPDRAAHRARRAAALTLAVLVLGQLTMLVLLLGHFSGNGWVAPAICAALVLLAVLPLRAALRRAPEDPRGARALVVLGAGLSLVALGATALMLTVFSIASP